MTDRSTSVDKPELCHGYAPLEWKRASKASICAFMLAFAPLSAALAQNADGGPGQNTKQPAPAAPASQHNSKSGNNKSSSNSGNGNKVLNPSAAVPATPATPAAPAAAAPAAAAPAAPAAASASTAAAEASVQQLEQVTVTGTAVPRADASTALPVATYHAQQLREEGVTSTSQVLERVSSNDTSAGPGSGYGLGINGGASYGNLRSLGTNSTLILLNGRRLANNAFNGGAVSLQSIPFSAIDRVEVLESGASAIYGTDAIAGVINFITKKNYKGGNFRLQYKTPTRSGGGPTRVLNGTFGYGDLAKDRFNVMGSFTYRTQDSVLASSRPDITQAFQPQFGINTTSILPFPANYLQGTGATQVAGNPTYAQGCPGQYARVNPHPGAVTADNPIKKDCVYDNDAFYDIQQNDDYASFFGQANYLITNNHKLSASFLYTHNRVDSQIGPYGVLGEMVPSSPYYPTQAIANDPNGDPTQPIHVLYRNTITGPRRTSNLTQSLRGVLSLKGHFGKLHYDTGLEWGQETTALTYTGGYLNATKLDNPALGPNLPANQNDNPNTPPDDYGDDAFSSAINNGTINPFNPNYTEATRNFFTPLVVKGQAEKDRSHQYTWDGKLNRDLGNWFGAGQLGLAIGGQVRYNKLDVYSNNVVENAIAGGGLSGMGLHQDRTIEAVYGDINIPILKSLSIEAAGRYDHYSDFGGTANPKVSIRWQPIHQLVMRAHYSTGFSAPNLYSLYTAQSITFSATGLDDPKLCPDGENPAKGYTATQVCNTQFERHYGGNRNLDPRTSQQYGFGFVAQPFRHLSASLDYFHIETDGDVSLLPVQQVFGNTDKYSDNIVRYQSGPNDGLINYIQTNYANLGKTHTQGLDTQLNYAIPTKKYGRFSLRLNGTYTLEYKFQSAPGTRFRKNVGKYVISSPEIAWRHNIELGWKYKGFNAEFINHYTAGYDDQFSQDHKHVNPFITYDASIGYEFDNGVHLQIGSNNIFDQDPPVSNQSTVGIPGYDPRYADAIGRTAYASVGYTFD